MKINFVFDNFYDNGDAVHNIVPFKMETYFSGWLHYKTINKMLTYNNDIISKHEVNFIRPSDIKEKNSNNEINIYPIFLHQEEIHTPWPILYLHKDIVDLVNNNYLKLGILSIFGTFNVDHEKYKLQLDWYLKTIHISKISNVFIMSTDFGCVDIMNKPIDSFHPEMILSSNKEVVEIPRFINANIYERAILDALEGFNKDNTDFIELYYKNLNKEKLFLFLNNIPRKQRYVMYKLLEFHKLLNDGFYSYRNLDNYDNHRNEYISDIGKTINDELLEYPEIQNFILNNPTINPILLDEDSIFDGSTNILENGSYINPKYIRDSYFSIICETGIWRSLKQISEKSYKMFYYCQPFIVLGAPGYLKELKRLGYKTFPELFDESYDDMPPSVAKIKFIISEVMKYNTTEGREELKQRLIEIRPSLEHNRKLFLSKDHNEIWTHLL